MGLVGLVHTTRLVLEPVHKAITTSCHGIDVSHVLDEGILRKLAAQGRITSEIVDWLTKMVQSAQDGGAEAAVVSCSSLSPCVNEVRERVAIPVFKVDEPMVEYAVTNAERIGLVMTNPTTETPSILLFKEVCDRLGRNPILVPRLCPEAFAMLSRGDVEGHDGVVALTIKEMVREVDLVMLAQISIARVKSVLDESISDRVLSSLDFIGEKIMEAVG